MASYTRRRNSPGSPRPTPWGTPGMWEAQGREDAANAFEPDLADQMHAAGQSPRAFVEELVHDNRVAWLVEFTSNYAEDIRHHFGAVDPAYVERAFTTHLRGWKAATTEQLERIEPPTANPGGRRVKLPPHRLPQDAMHFAEDIYATKRATVGGLTLHVGDRVEVKGNAYTWADVKAGRHTTTAATVVALVKRDAILPGAVAKALADNNDAFAAYVVTDERGLLTAAAFRNVRKIR